MHYLLRKSDYFINYLVFFLIIIFLLLIIDSFIVIIFGKNLLNNQYDGHRLTSLFGDEKKMGYFLYIFGTLFFSIIFKFNNLNKIIILSLTILSCILILLIILSGERNTLLKLVIMLLLCLFFLNLNIKRKILIFSTFILVGITTVFMNSNIYYRYISYTYDEMNLPSENFVIINEKYHNIYHKSYIIFKDNFLIGIGPKMFRKECKEYYFLDNNKGDGCSTHPHNLYVQLLVETGIIGTIPIIFIFFYIMYLQFKNYKSNYFKNDYNSSTIISCLFLSNLFPLATYGNFLNNWVSITFFFSFAFLNFYLLMTNNEKR